MEKRRGTDYFFLLLFVGGAIVPQLAFASRAISAGGAAAQESLSELPEGLFQMLACAMGLCTLAGLAFLQLTRCFPMRLMVYGAILSSAGFLIWSGLALAFDLGGDADDAQMAVGAELGGMAPAMLPSSSSSPGEAVSKVVRARIGDVLILGGVLEFLIVAWFWAEIQLSLAVLRTTSAFLWDAPWVSLLYPPLFGLAHMLGLALWGAAAMGTVELLGSEDELGRALRERYAVHSVLGLMVCYFWGNGFVTALSTFATARLTAEWYFAPASGKRRVAEPSAALRVIAMGIWKHGGSLALGSLLLALLRVLNILLFWAGKNHQRTEEDSAARRFWLRARELASGLVEAFGRFASRQAFVEVAVSGCTFFEGAQRAARRVVAAPKRFAAVEAAGALQRSATEVLLVSLTAFAAWGLEATRVEELRGPDAQGASPSLVVPACVGAWLVAESVLHPVSVATTTVLHCWLLDGCGAGAGDAAHTPEPLRALLRDDGSFASHYA